MKAIVYDEYGAPDLPELRDVSKPVARNVCSTRNVDLVRSIGAGHVIDYTQQDFTRGGPRYDLILDNAGNRSVLECRRALTPHGTLLPMGVSHATDERVPLVGSEAEKPD
jgi:NADPH:quinone reductase-like Zn-dependent oxidoreductase